MRWLTPEVARGLRPVVKLIARIAIGLMVVVMGTLIVYVATERYLSVNKLDDLVDEAALVESFNLVMHTQDNDANLFNPSRKWITDIPVHFDTSVPAWQRQAMESQFPILTRLTGLRFLDAPEFDPENSVVVVTAKGPDAMQSAVDQFLGRPYPVEGMDNVLCFAFVPDDPGGRIRRALAVIGDTEPTASIRSCLIEELLHTLGPVADHATYPLSIFSEFTYPDAIPLNDKILLRALYDPAIKPGMSHWETQELIPGIVHRLVVGVKARGEAALYQR